MEASQGNVDLVKASIPGDRGHNMVTTLASRVAFKDTVVFFPGDRLPVEAYEDASLDLYEISQLAYQALRLSDKFPDYQVVLIEPCRFYSDCHACYDNFLNQVTASGEPMGYISANLRAVKRLIFILEEVGCSPDGELQIAGFSKGAVVLNQLLTEMAWWATHRAVAEIETDGYKNQDRVDGFLSRIAAVHYLDAGLNCRGVYITDPAVTIQLGHWAQMHSLRLCLHGTPRQWSDRHRPWLWQEKDRCMQLMASAGVAVHEQLYFSGQRPSLEMHFRIITEMDPNLGLSTDNAAI